MEKLSLFLVFILLCACTKKYNNTNVPQRATLTDNLYILDAVVQTPRQTFSNAEMHLVSSALDLQNGIYTYNGKNFPDIKKGDFIAGSDSNGYLRKITSVASKQASSISFNTTQAALADVINGKISFSFYTGNSYDLSNFALDSGNLLQSDASMTFNSKISMSLECNQGNIINFAVTCDSAYLANNVKVTSNNPTASLSLSNYLVKKASIKSIQKLGVLPIIFNIDASLFLNMQSSTSIYNKWIDIFNDNITFNVGAIYSASNSWYPTEGAFFLNNPVYQEICNFSLLYNASIKPTMTMSIYGIPVTNASLTNACSISSSYGASDWTMSWSKSLVRYVSVNPAVIGNVPSYENTWGGNSSPNDYLSGYAPCKLFGKSAYKNTSPVVVQVFDDNGVPLPNVPVHFSVFDPTAGAVSVLLSRTSGTNYPDFTGIVLYDGSDCGYAQTSYIPQTSGHNTVNASIPVSTCSYSASFIFN